MKKDMTYHVDKNDRKMLMYLIAVLVLQYIDKMRERETHTHRQNAEDDEIDEILLMISFIIQLISKRKNRIVKYVTSSLS